MRTLKTILLGLMIILGVTPALAKSIHSTADKAPMETPDDDIDNTGATCR
jgi:hypothetical protein